AMNRFLTRAVAMLLTAAFAMATPAPAAPSRITCTVSGLIASGISYSFELDESIPRMTWLDNAYELDIFHLDAEVLKASKSPEVWARIHAQGIEFQLDRSAMELRVMHYGKPTPDLARECDVGRH